ncbi:hypothetical protein FQN60_015056 [Etheostoma spectabile]|uniref:Shadow of prion protein n=1 Tax=Etheostoma spectabile TaxID=54343 RepID=A0A5J5CP33_9PERO|nr:hypothetical protein FQN60_015056 [Etheostoma spectabile]
MNQVVATCWTCLLLSAFLCEPVLSKGGRGGSRGSSRGSHSRSSTAGSYRGGGAYGGTRSRVRVAGRSSAVRVASAAAAGAAVAVALTADKWYASAYRSSKADNSEEELDFYNRTNYFDAQINGFDPLRLLKFYSNAFEDMLDVIARLLEFIRPPTGALLPSAG